MYENKVDSLVLATLVADTHCLGSHWIYDRDELTKLDVNWDELNAPHVAWHEGKKKGDFTHYGDQINILVTYLKENPTSFDVKTYLEFWKDKMTKIDTYMDAATNDTIKYLCNHDESSKSHSHDSSVIGRIVPLLKISKDKEEFLHYAYIFAKATHNNEEVLEATHFFASLLLEVLEGKDIVKSIEILKKNYSQNIQNYINAGLQTKENDTIETLDKFGIHCGIEVGFSGIIHILSKYDNFKEALIANARCGGDNSSRAMIIAAILIAKHDKSHIPLKWQEYIKR